MIYKQAMEIVKNKQWRPRKENRITATAEYQREWKKKHPWYWAKKIKEWRSRNIERKNIFTRIREKRNEQNKVQLYVPKNSST